MDYLDKLKLFNGELKTTLTKRSEKLLHLFAKGFALFV